MRSRISIILFSIATILVGQPSFNSHTITTTANAAHSVFATDLDGDGDVDVLSASFTDNKIAWYENDGSQTFTAHTITTTAEEAYSVYATDVDGDGDVDVISAYPYSSYFDKVVWYENDGSQGFTEHTITTTADGVYSVYATDVDGDGDVDVLSASFSSYTIHWYENDGSQSFTAHTITITAGNVASVYATDVDGDGYVDVLSASSNDDKIAWYENLSPKRSILDWTGNTITTTADGAESVYATDVDGDGDVDVLSASFSYDKIAWYQNDGSQSFTAHTITTTADGARSVYALDVDGDGDMDVLSASEYDDKIAWYENDGSQGFTAHTITTTANGAYSVYATDVDGDGDVDVLSASINDDKIAWYENDGSQSFTARTITTSADGAYSVYATDVDGDGYVDVLSASSNDDKIAWYENDGSQTFTAHTITTTADAAHSVYATDVDGDGDVDVLSASYEDNKIAWYENDGSQGFTAHTVTTTANGAYSVYATDVDGDGDVDVLSASINDDKIAWYENDGSQGFTAHTITTTADFAVSVYATDVDGDGDVDVLSASGNDDKIAWYKSSVDAAVPSSPTGFTATPGNTQVTLKWSRNAEIDVAKYRIYGGTSTNPTIKVDSTTNVSDTTNTITGLTNGTTYYYLVTAVDHAGNESGYSSEVNATPYVPTITVTSPNGGENWNEDNFHKITWSTTHSEEITRIQLLYSIDNGLNYTTIVDSTANDGSANWRIPRTPSTSALVKIIAYHSQGQTVEDVSDAIFTLQDVDTYVHATGAVSQTVRNDGWSGSGGATFAASEPSLEFPPDSGKHHLYLNEILIATIDANGDTIATLPYGGSDFLPMELVSVTQYTDRVETRTRYKDKFGLDIEVGQRTIGPNNKSFVIYAFTIHNKSAVTYSQFHVAFYNDFDVNDYSQNLSGYDTSNRLAYMYDVTGGWSSYAGIRMLDKDPTNFRRLLSSNDPKTQGDVFQILASSIIDDPSTDEAADYRIIESYGSLSLSPGDSAMVVYAMVAGEGLSGLKTTSQNAQTFWTSQMDSLALVALYNSTDGVNWTTKTNWLTGALSTWYGVTVSGGRVTQVDLSVNNLSGTIPAKIGNLTALEGLYLNENSLTGSVPNTIGNLTSLQALSLHTNQLSGSIPTTIGELTGLTELYLYANQLSVIPDEIGKLTGLTHLRLDNNQFTGTIPDTLANLTSLQVLNLNSNQLTGSIPSVIGSLTNLTDLKIRSNQLSGSIPTTIGNLEKLEILWLHNNQLTGSIPSEIGNCDSMKYLILYGNQLSGSIPTTIGNLTKLLYLYLYRNQLTGTIPDTIRNLTGLQYLYISENQLTDTIPTFIGNLTDLKGLALGDNQITGSIPDTLGNLANLEALWLENSQLSGTIPTVIGKLTNLKYLSLYNNILTGSIPTEIGKLTNLLWVHLQKNQLTGSVPDSIVNLTSLTELKLQDNQLDGLPDLTSLTTLDSVKIENNKFTFEDIESNVTLPNFSYAPQDSVGSKLDMTVYVDASLTLTVSVGGTANQYQWEKDGNDISGANSSSYALSSVILADSGSYKCTITNTTVTALTLYSRPVNATVILDTTAAAAPQNLTATPGNGQVNLKWSQNTESDLGKYRLYYGPASNPTTLKDSTTSVNDTTLTITGLTNGATYYFRLKAVDDAGNSSGFSDEVSAIPVSKEIALSDSSHSFGEVQIDNTVSWDLYLKNVGTDTLTVSNITKSIPEFSVSTTSGVIVTGDSMTVTVTFSPAGLMTYPDSLKIYSNDSDTADTLKIVALTGAGIDTLPPGIPQNLSAAGDDGQVALSWSPNTESDFKRYRIYGDTVTNPTTRVDSTTGGVNDTSKTITGLTNGTTYYYRITAVDSMGNESGYSSEVSATPRFGTITVKPDGSGDFTTIQAAIDIASNSDTVLVYDGIYVENIDYSGKNIIVKSSSGAENTSIKPADGGVPIVWFQSSETSDAKLIGFQLTDGGNVKGSAIKSEGGSSPLIENCIITNSAGEAVIGFYYSGAKLQNCLIHDNAARVFFWDPGEDSPQIINCTIVNNTGSEGLGRNDQSYVPEYKNCIIYGNDSVGDYGNVSMTYSLVEGGFSGTGNIDVDPLFVDPAGGDFHLTDFSPAIGSGTATGTPETDLEEITRGVTPDMGAYEHSYESQRPKCGSIQDGLSADIDWTNSDTSLAANWYQFVDDSSVTYELAIGSSQSILSDVLTWTSVGPDTLYVATGLTLKSDSTYYVSVRGTDTDSQVSDTTTSDGVILDTEPPVVSSVVETASQAEGDFDWYGMAQDLKLGWTGSDNGLLDHYEFLIITAQAQDTVANWTNCGLKTDTTLTGLSLQEGPQYYTNVRATDIAGNTSEITSSDGFRIDGTAPTGGNIVVTNLTEGKYLTSGDSVACQVTGFADAGSGLLTYQLGMGTAPGSDEVNAFHALGLVTTPSIKELSLKDYETYYISVFARDSVGNSSEAVSSQGFITYRQFLGDFDDDKDIDVDDMSQFVTRWPEVDLGPVTGDVPYLIPELDSIANLRDLATFARMWHWSYEQGLFRVVPREDSEGLPVAITLRDSQIVFSLPEGVTAGQIVVDYQGGVTDISCDQSEVSPNRLVLVQEQEGIPQLLVEFGYFSSGGASSITFTADITGREDSEIKISYLLYADKEVIAEGSQVLDLVAIPDEYALHHNYPNPFNPITIIEYDLPVESRVSLVVYNLLGQQVIRLVDQNETAGYKSIRWDGTDAAGQQVAAGLYFYQILVVPAGGSTRVSGSNGSLDQPRNYLQTRKMILLK